MVKIPQIVSEKIDFQAGNLSLIIRWWWWLPSKCSSSLLPIYHQTVTPQFFGQIICLNNGQVMFANALVLPDKWYSLHLYCHQLKWVPAIKICVQSLISHFYEWKLLKLSKVSKLSPLPKVLSVKVWHMSNIKIWKCSRIHLQNSYR